MILLLDNYDSFTYNILHYLQEATSEPVQVVRNDGITAEEAEAFDSIVLSPGPGLPGEAGIMPEILRQYISRKKILGVCLGHQAIAVSLGGSLLNMEKVRHGVGNRTIILDRKDPVFKNLPETLITGRYHSWTVNPENLPDSLRTTALDEEGNIMAIRHIGKPVWGLQFHPESVLTEYGKIMIKNWLDQ